MTIEDEIGKLETFKISICKRHRKQFCHECSAVLNDLMHKTCPRRKKPEQVVEAWRKTINDKSKELFLCIDVVEKDKILADRNEKDAEIKRLRGSIKDLLEARKSEIERLEAELGKVLKDMAKLEAENAELKAMSKIDKGIIRLATRNAEVSKKAHSRYVSIDEVKSRDERIKSLEAEKTKLIKLVRLENERAGKKPALTAEMIILFLEAFDEEMLPKRQLIRDIRREFSVLKGGGLG